MMSSPVDAQAVAHAVVAGEVRRGLGRRDDVVGRQRVFRVRQRDVDDLGARRRVSQSMPCCHSASISAGMPSTRYSFGMPIRRPLHALADRRLVVRHRRRRREVVSFGSTAGHRPQQDRRVAHGAGDRPGLVERGGEGDDAPARAAAVGRLDADGAGEGGRLADRAAGVGRRSRRRRDAPRPPPPSRPTSRPAPGRRCRRARRHGLTTGP